MFAHLFQRRTQLYENLRAAQTGLVFADAKLQEAKANENAAIEKLTQWNADNMDVVPYPYERDQWRNFIGNYQKTPLVPHGVSGQRIFVDALWQKYIHLTDSELRTVCEFAADQRMSFDWKELRWHRKIDHPDLDCIRDFLRQINIPALQFTFQYGTSTELTIYLHRQVQCSTQKTLWKLLCGKFEGLIPEERWLEILQLGILDKTGCLIRHYAVLAAKRYELMLTCGSSYKDEVTQQYQVWIDMLKEYPPAQILAVIQQLLEFDDEWHILTPARRSCLQSVKLVDDQLQWDQ